MMVLVNDDLVIAHPNPNGFTSTLASWLGKLIAEAESEFGPRDTDAVIIQLGLFALQDTQRALFQLSHETVHLLDLAPGGTNNLEEGAAIYFSLQFMRRQFGVSYETGDARYDAVCNLVQKMSSLRSGAIKELRSLYGPLKNITSQQILAVCPDVGLKVTEKLAMPFI